MSPADQEIDRPAVLLMAYGAPQRLDQVEAYYTDIRRGVPPPPDRLEALLDRYRAIGGRSPLADLVEGQRAALASQLAARGAPIPVYAGMRHSEPRIGRAVHRMAADGVTRAVAIALAPQRSSNGAGYRLAVEAAAAALGGRAPQVTFVESWHDQPRFIEALAQATADALAGVPNPAAALVIFTAHSLPSRAVDAGDRYPAEVARTAQLVARRLGLEHWRVAYQSAGRTAEAWLGPDLRDEMRRAAADGVTQLVVCPVGFVTDHLEVLYDIDIEARAVADELGVRLERARSLNADPTFIAGLADLVANALAGSADPIVSTP
ncbi:MAG: ferrochelatase [Candidatus Limnocylindrales bacterium]